MPDQNDGGSQNAEAAAAPAFAAGGGRLRDPGGPRAALVSWAVIVAAVTGLMLLQGLRGDASLDAPAPGAKAAEVSESPEEFKGGLFLIVAQTIVGAEPSQRGSAVGMMPMVQRSRADEVHAALVLAEVQSVREGVGRLEALAARNAGMDDVLTRDAELFRRVLAGETIAGHEREGLVARHGWFGRLALSVGHPDADPQRAAVLREARRVVAISTGFNIGLLATLFMSICLSAVAVVLVATGRVRRAYAPPAPGGSVFIEMFAVFLVGFALLSLAAAVLEGYIGSAAGLLRWLAILIVLYPLARGMSWQRARYAIGWHRGRGAVREMAAGVVGYVVCLPIVAVGIAMTLGLMAVSAALREDAKAPAHPLGDMLAGASTLELFHLVLLATVWAPVVEETVFRGALYHHVRGRLGMIVSALVVGVLFAAIHPQGWMGVPALTGIAVVLAMLREWRGSLLASVAAHAANNAVITVLLLALFRIL